MKKNPELERERELNRQRNEAQDAERRRGYETAKSENPNIDTMSNADLFVAAMRASVNTGISIFYLDYTDREFLLGMYMFFMEKIRERGLREYFNPSFEAYGAYDRAVMLRLPGVDGLKAAFLDSIPKD